MSSPHERARVFLANYPVECGNLRLAVRQVRLSRAKGGKLAVSVTLSVINARPPSRGRKLRLASAPQQPIAVSLEEVSINGNAVGKDEISFSYNCASSSVSVAKSPINLALDVTDPKRVRPVYFVVSYRCEDGKLVIERLGVYSTRFLRVKEYNVFQTHDDPFSASTTVTYTIVNETDSSLRYIPILADRMLRGLKVTDERGADLPFFTRDSLTAEFPEGFLSQVPENVIIVDLMRDLEPGEARVISVKGFKEVDEEDRYFVINVRLLDDVDERVVIQPPIGYVARVGRGDIELEADGKAIPVGKCNSSVTLGRAEVELRCEPRPDNRGEIVSGSAIEINARAYGGDNVGLNVYYSVEVQHRWFWDIFLAFFSAVVTALFAQEIVTDVLALPLVLSMPLLVLGGAIGLSAFYAYTNYVPRRLNRKLVRLARTTFMVVTTLASFLVIVWSTAVHGSELSSRMNSLLTPYIEIEFAVLVVLELAYALAEKAVRDEYRDVVLALTVLGVLSMFLLLPWA